MKKENLFGILMYLVVFAIAVVYGFTVLQSHFADSTFNEVGSYALYILVSVFSGVIATALFQEFGHILGASVGGYKVTSCNVLLFNFYKDNGKTKFRFASFDGLTGETKITPNYEKKEKPNPYPYLLYGTIFNLAIIVAGVFLFFTYYKSSGILGDLAYYFLTMSIINLMAVIYNIVPIKLDSLTDGYRLTRIKGDVDSFNALLEAENGGTINNGDVRGDKLDKKIGPAKFIPEVAISELSDYLLKEDYEGLFNSVKKINEYESHLSDKDLLENKAQYIYASLLTKKDAELATFYENEVPFSLRRELSNSYNFVVIRTYIYVAGMMDGSLSECLLSCKKIVKALKTLPKNRRHTEIILFNKMLDLVIKAHPKWEELKNYVIVE